MSNWFRCLLVLGAPLSAMPFAAGCANDLAPADDEIVSPPGDDDDDDGGFPTVSGAFTHTVAPDGVLVTTVVDATDAEGWQPLDLDTGLAAEDGAWELAFSRFRIRVNGGVSGDGGVEVAALVGRAFDDVDRAPADGWTSAWEDGEDDDQEPDNAFNNGTDDWYDYELSTHTLTPRDVTYVVRSTDDAYFKLRFDDYYDQAGSPAVITFRWAEVDPPGDDQSTIPEDAFFVDASDREAWVHVAVGEGVVEVDDPAEDLGWDVAFQRVNVRTNSGTSGPGLGGARLDESGLPYDAISQATTFGYVEDAILESERPGVEPTSGNEVLGRWWDYDGATRTVSPGDRTYVLRTADGGYAKLRVWSWDDGLIAVTLRPVDRRVDVRSLEVDASSQETWTYVSVRDGVVVEDVAEPETDPRWDAAFQRVALRTNGGTSGEGLAAAVEVEVDGIIFLDQVPEDGFVADENIPASRPGAEDLSANPVLADWFDYDPATRTASPRETVYVVRTADGHFGALQITDYADGVFQVDVAYAGPGRLDF